MLFTVWQFDNYDYYNCNIFPESCFDLKGRVMQMQIFVNQGTYT